MCLKVGFTNKADTTNDSSWEPPGFQLFVCLCVCAGECACVCVYKEDFSTSCSCEPHPPPSNENLNVKIKRNIIFPTICLGKLICLHTETELPTKIKIFFCVFVLMSMVFEDQNKKQNSFQILVHIRICNLFFSIFFFFFFFDFFFKSVSISRLC